MNVDIELKQRGSRVHTKLYIAESMTTEQFAELCTVLKKVLALANAWEKAIEPNEPAPMTKAKGGKE